MPGHFVSTWRVRPPMNQTLLCASGGSFFFAALFRFAGWQMVFGGRMESIAEPTRWWLEDGMELSQEIAAPSPVVTKRTGQLTFDLSDSEKPSRSAA